MGSGVSKLEGVGWEVRSGIQRPDTGFWRLKSGSTLFNACSHLKPSCVASRKSHLWAMSAEWEL